MKVLNAFTFVLLLAAGCNTYPEHQSTYSTSSYSTQPTSTGDQVISTPTYDTGTVASAPYTTSPSYSSGVAQGAAAWAQDTDTMLISRVRQALNNSPTVNSISRRINISSRNGVVTINGAVPSEQDRQTIDAVIRSTTGVRSLDDQLQIYAQPTGAADTRIYSTAPVVANPSEPGSIFNLHVQGLNEPDRALAQRILQELRTDTILPSILPAVNITVADGRVTLEGNVQSEQQRQTIESAVRRATGGNTINNLLQVM